MSICSLTKNWRCHKVSTIVFFLIIFWKKQSVLCPWPHISNNFYKIVSPFGDTLRSSNLFIITFCYVMISQRGNLIVYSLKHEFQLVIFKQICRGGGAVGKSICPARGRWDFESQPRQTYVNKTGKDSSNAKRLSTGVTRLRTLTV